VSLVGGCVRGTLHWGSSCAARGSGRTERERRSAAPGASSRTTFPPCSAGRSRTPTTASWTGSAWTGPTLETHGEGSAPRLRFTITDTAARNHRSSPIGALMWSKDATMCRLGSDASCPSALWVFSPRSIGPSILWISMYTWRSGPASTRFKLFKYYKFTSLRRRQLADALTVFKGLSHVLDLVRGRPETPLMLENLARQSI